MKSKKECNSTGRWQNRMYNFDNLPQVTEIIIIAFSRSERTHPNLVSQASQARENRDFLWTAN